MRRFLHQILSVGSHSSQRRHEAQETEEGDRRTSVFDMTTTTLGPSAHSPPLSASIMGFGIDLYRQLVLHTAGSHGASSKGAGTPGNVVFSPFAVAAALSMTLAGARCGTARELEAALHARDDEQIHSHFAAQLSRITSHALKVVFEVNNRMYTDQRYPVIESYRAFLHDTYGANTMHTVDFSSRHGEVLAEANDCVARASSNTVRDVVGSDSFGPSTQLALVSGAYFCGAWESPFQPAFTGPDEFHVDAHTVVRVNMMNQMQPFGIAHSDQLQATALEMPHLGGKTCMVIILPDKMDGLPELERNLTPRNLSDLLHNIPVRPNVMLKLPKFVVQLSCKLREPLKAMGVRELFTARANLSGIFETGSPALADVFHGTFLGVNEMGAETTSPSAEVLVGGGPGLGEITRLTVNRPFMFLIKPRHGNVLFIMGSVRRP
ncbi:ipis-1-like [Dermacentor albipictus]|uniref:ipis-1-like n=1 Tax=Dermacentor albipictus TaxID=60249 RepID=UPI0031FD5D8A